MFNNGLAFTLNSQIPLTVQPTGGTATLAPLTDGLTNNTSIGNEIQTLSFSGTPSGTFTLTFNGLTTAPITYGSGGAALAADIQAKLAALLSTADPTTTGNIAVTNPSTDPNIIQIVFQNALGHRNVSQVSASCSAAAERSRSARLSTVKSPRRSET